MTEQIALRFPEGTRDRIKALARDGETMTGVVLRALAALEGQGDRGRPDDTGRAQGEPDALSVRLAALESRVGALERTGSLGGVAFETRPFETKPKPDSSEPNGSEYPAEAKDMAVGMLARGCTPAEIRAALERTIGRAPGPKHLSRTLRRWSGQAGGVSE
jgi:hypothetical protein